MSPLELALSYMSCFYNSQNWDALEAILSPSLRFRGPFKSYDSSEAYLRDLRADPPLDMGYESLQIYESIGAVCLFYQMRKGDLRVPMAQTFQVKGKLISEIELVFDTALFKA